MTEEEKRMDRENRIDNLWRDSYGRIWSCYMGIWRSRGQDPRSSPPHDLVRKI